MIAVLIIKWRALPNWMPREMFEECIRAASLNIMAWERQQADRVQISDLNEEVQVSDWV